MHIHKNYASIYKQVDDGRQRQNEKVATQKPLTYKKLFARDTFFRFLEKWKSFK